MGFPSKEQKAVIDRRGSPLLLLPRPGPGKTDYDSRADDKTTY